MSSIPTTRPTPEEFLDRERAAEEKHEYWSTRKSDRGDKVFLYRRMPSMREILLEPVPTMIEHYSKLPNGHWELETITNRSAVIQLLNLNQSLPVAEVYRDIEILSA